MRGSHARPCVPLQSRRAEPGESHGTSTTPGGDAVIRRGRAPIWLEVLQFGLGIALLGISLQEGRWLFVALAAFYLVLISFRAVNSRRKPPRG